MTLKNELLHGVITVSLIIGIAFSNSGFSADPIFADEEIIEFDSISYTYKPSPFKVKQAKKLGTPLEVKIEPSVSLTGYLAKPPGEKPRAAIVLLHGCTGIIESDEMWSDRLVSWGYVVFTVDSFTPRGFENLCEGERVTSWARTLDAYGAKQYLETRSFVDPARVAVMGRSHGGMTVLEIIKQSISDDLAVKPFQAAIAFYPYCREPVPIDPPTLILTGEEDQWHPAEFCTEYLSKSPSKNKITLKVFAGAYHSFDEPGADGIEAGQTYRYHPEAAAKASNLARKFLEEKL